jgi:ABC-type Na+ efflux pump permease subunit
MTRWTQVSRGTAEQHKLYGLTGWLALFLVGNVLAVARGWIEYAAVARQLGISVADLNERMPGHHVALLIQLFAVAALVAIAATKAKSFRWIATILLLVTVPGAIAAAAAVDTYYPSEQAMQSLPAWVLACLAWIPYLHRSRRVRVTFDNQLQTAELEERDEIIRGLAQFAARSGETVAGAPCPEVWS